MSQEETSVDSALRAVAELGGTARAREILAAGVHPRGLYAARDAGALVEVTRGVFRLEELPLTEPDLVAVATRMPWAVLCLVTALHLHGITLEIPRAVHVALPRGVHPARLAHPPLEVYHVSEPSYEAGVQERRVDGVPVRVTSPAKSVADAFKFRSRVGLETAVDALRQTLQQGAGERLTDVHRRNQPAAARPASANRELFQTLATALARPPKPPRTKTAPRPLSPRGD